MGWIFCYFQVFEQCIINHNVTAKKSITSRKYICQLARLLSTQSNITVQMKRSKGNANKSDYLLQPSAILPFFFLSAFLSFSFFSFFFFFFCLFSWDGKKPYQKGNSVHRLFICCKEIGFTITMHDEHHCSTCNNKIKLSFF